MRVIRTESGLREECSKHKGNPNKRKACLWSRSSEPQAVKVHHTHGPFTDLGITHSALCISYTPVQLATTADSG